MNKELAYLIQNFYISVNGWMKYQFKNQVNSNCNLTFPQFKVLYIINKEKICSMSNLSEMMEVSKGTMTTMLNKLVEDGYVKRSNSYKDRRTVFVELTEIGIERINCVQDKLIDSLGRVTEKLDEEQQREVGVALLKLKELFKNRK
ncbi:MarR family winged helix-turn-helix transcriptional regulator [Alkaliphilus transvaalensis]|uniref:MarR family winged helix-turn-helix transcriptional regulator n=1 Tax=Alkaliphilus transvaalensis TaxID=114628 RepID=UPI00047B81BA|nr:MarR family transcriptional regulator [Alkaliphilus transvaalensis]